MLTLSRGSQLAVGMAKEAELTEPSISDARLMPPVLAMVCVPLPLRPAAESKLKLPLGVPRL